MLPPPSPVDPDTKPRTPVAVSRCRVLGDLEVLVAWHIIRSRRIAGFQRVLAESSREVTKVSRGLPRRCRCFLLGGRTGTGEDQRATDLVAVGLVSRDDADGGSRWFFFDRGPATKKKKCPAHAGMNGQRHEARSSPVHPPRHHRHEAQDAAGGARVKRRRSRQRS